MSQRDEEELQRTRETLQETMNFLGAVAAGLEDAVGESAKSITYLAGKNLGHRVCVGARRTNDVEEALVELRRVLKENGCLWTFDRFHSKASRSTSAQEGADEVLLVFRDCMIRQALFSYGHPQKGSLCNMMFGFFAGALETIMGRTSRLEIKHAGENACLKCLTIDR
ncbi:MAG: hypothetical protein WCI05_04255 [Myxococcales bacterium]